MNNDIKLFANLCIEQEILSAADCQKVGQRLRPDTPLLDFAQLILEDGREADFEKIQELLNETEDLIAENKIAGTNPFKQTDSTSTAESERPKIRLPSATKKPAEEPAPRPEQSSAAPSAAAPSAAAPSAPAAKSSSLEHSIHTDGVSPAWFEPTELETISESEARQTMIALLLMAAHEGASDLHICAGSRIFVRHNRAIVYKSTETVSADLAEKLNRSILSEKQSADFTEKQDLDFALPLSTGRRFRVNLMQQREGVAGTYRIVPASISSLKDLGFDNADTIKEILAHHNGLILVTGPVGSGKTTTLAALIEVLNQTREDHVIVIEEPIETIQLSNRCQITQRGVGSHTQSYKRALKGALRQDPDIIVIGEMRDLETIEMAISASETGHLVIATMHTSDAATTLNRLLDVFPPAQQPQIRSMVAESLRGIICQRLLPDKDGNLVMASELLLQNIAVASSIREGKTQALGNIMETGRSAGMRQMDNSVLELWKEGKIDAEIAIQNIRNRMLHPQILNQQ